MAVASLVFISPCGTLPSSVEDHLNNKLAQNINMILVSTQPDIIWNMTAVEVFQLLQATEVTYESLTHILSNLRTEEFDMIFDIASSEEQMQVSYYL